MGIATRRLAVYDGSPFTKASQAVLEAEPRYVRARLIELAAMVAAGDEAKAVVK